MENEKILRMRPYTEINNYKKNIDNTLPCVTPRQQKTTTKDKNSRT